MKALLACLAFALLPTAAAASPTECLFDPATATARFVNDAADASVKEVVFCARADGTRMLQSRLRVFLATSRPLKMLSSRIDSPRRSKVQ